MAIAVNDDYCDQTQFYFPLVALQVSYMENWYHQSAIKKLDCILGLHLKLVNDANRCQYYGMYRKMMLELDTSEIHLIKLKNIEYPIWTPHACNMEDRRNLNHPKCCNIISTHKRYKLAHNYTQNKLFFCGAFACKWKALHYIMGFSKSINIKNCDGQENIETTDDESDSESEIMLNEDVLPSTKSEDDDSDIFSDTDMCV